MKSFRIFKEIGAEKMKACPIYPQWLVEASPTMQRSLESYFVPARCCATARKREAYLVVRKRQNNFLRDAKDGSRIGPFFRLSSGQDGLFRKDRIFEPTVRVVCSGASMSHRHERFNRHLRIILGKESKKEEERLVYDSIHFQASPS